MGGRLVSQALATALPRTHKAVLVALCSHADDETGGNCFPGVDAVAYEASVSRRTAQYIMKELRQANFIKLASSNNGGRGNRASYIVTPEKGAPDALFIESRKGASDCKTPIKGASVNSASDDKRVHLTAEKGASDDTALRGLEISENRQVHTEVSEGESEGGYERAFDVVRQIPAWPKQRELVARKWLARDGISEEHAYGAALALKAQYNPKKHKDLVATLVQWSNNERKWVGQREQKTPQAYVNQQRAGPRRTSTNGLEQLRNDPRFADSFVGGEQ